MELLNAGVIKPGETLRFYNREDTLAEVTPRGTVLFRGVEYSSLGRRQRSHESCRKRLGGMACQAPRRPMD